MKKVAVIGGIGSGKSFVCELLKKHGQPTFSFDDEAKKLMNSDTDIRFSLIKAFGKDIYKKRTRINGFVYENSYELNKEELGKIIFSNDSKRIQVEKIIKPALMKRFYELCYIYEYEDNKSLFFAESATMIKTGLYKNFDKVLVVNADFDKRLEKVTSLRGMSKDDFISRNKMQMSFYDTINLLDSVNIDCDVFHNEYIVEDTEKFVLDYIKYNI